METLKTKILIYIIIFLVALNLATIGTIIWHVKTTTTKQPDTTKVINTQKIDSPPVRKRGQPFWRIMRELNLTEEQKAAFIQEHKKFISNVRPLILELREYRKKIDQELAKTNPNMRKIRTYSRKIGRIHTKLSILQSEYYLDLIKHCTPEQRQQLYNIYHKSQTTHNWRRPRKY